MFDLTATQIIFICLIILGIFAFVGTVDKFIGQEKQREKDEELDNNDGYWR